MKLTTDGVKKIDEMQIPDRYDLWISELEAIKQYSETFGKSAPFYMISLAYKMGFKRGMSYQSKHPNRLAKLRGNRTIKEVASVCNISPESLRAYEQGKRQPRDEVKLRLSRFYDCPVESLF